MAKFCTKCGKELVEGTCECVASQSAQQSTTSKTVVSGFDFQTMKNKLMNVVMKPNDGLKGMVKGTDWISLSVILALIVLPIIALVVTFINGILGEFAQYMGSMGISIPYAQIIFYLLLTVVTSVLSATVAIYGVGTLMNKEQMNFVKIIHFVVGSYVFAALGSVLAMIVGFVSFEYAIYILALGFILANVAMIVNFEVISKIDINKRVYAILVVIVAQALLTYVMTYHLLLPMMTSSVSPF